MRSLRLWISENSEETEHSCYNLIARTKKALIKEIEEHWNKDAFIEINQIEINYTDTFNLFDRLTGEGGGRRNGYKTLSTYYKVGLLWLKENLNI